MINSIDEIISSIKKGEMVIIMDDENRENEGDLVMASQFVKATELCINHVLKIILTSFSWTPSILISGILNCFLCLAY